MLSQAHVSPAGFWLESRQQERSPTETSVETPNPKCPSRHQPFFHWNMTVENFPLPVRGIFKACYQTKATRISNLGYRISAG